MAVSFFFRYLALFLLCLLRFNGADAKSPFSFSVENFDKNLNFSSKIALHGDAEIRNSNIVLFSKGRVMYKKPIRFHGRNPGFSTEFSFSITGLYGESESIGFLLVPSNVSVISRILQPSFLTVKLVIADDDSDGGHVEIDIGGEISVRSNNLSTVGLDLKNGQRLLRWIDYDGVSNIVEVRIGKFMALRPKRPIVSRPIDLPNVMWREAMYACINSSSAQISTLYSWSFAVKHGATYRMHSEPLDPRSLSGSSHRIREGRRRILVALFGAACGAMAVHVVCLLRSKVVKRHAVAPVEYPELKVESGYEKVRIDGGKIVSNSAK